MEPILHPTCLDLLFPHNMQRFHSKSYKHTISNVRKHNILLALLNFLGKLTCLTKGISPSQKLVASPYALSTSTRLWIEKGHDSSSDSPKFFIIIRGIHVSTTTNKKNSSITKHNMYNVTLCQVPFRFDVKNAR